jgi:hypothetical protein
MKRFHLIILLNILSLSLLAQQGTIKGRIYDAVTNEPVPFANIIIFGTTIGSSSDLDGNFLFTGLEPGFKQLAVSAVGYEQKVTEDFRVTNANTAFVDVAMNPKEFELQEVVIKASPFTRSKESPLSVQTLQISEIEKSPGGNRDISRVIQILPGVASTPAFRNDVIVRGGGANENSFYLDGIEIPNLNHFSTQGASGGPVGIINADFLREAQLYTSAFPVDKGRGLSSILDMKLIDGNKDNWVIRGSLGATDLAITLNGPVTKNSTLLFSYRRSYLQFLFDVLGLPFLPTYNDLLLKYKIRLDEKNEISFLSISSLDQFRLNTGLENPDESQQYILNYIPVNEQWSYTIGATYKHFHKKGFTQVVLSRNMLNNRIYKYLDNVEIDDNKTFDYSSQEAENKLRVEHTTQTSAIRFTYGAGLNFARYTNETFQKLFTPEGEQTINYNSLLRLFQWKIFGQLSKPFFNDRLTLSFGLRMDANNYTPHMANLLNQISPRFSASVGIVEGLYFNFSTGRYFQRPAYTTLGYRNNEGDLVNKENDIRYISSDHLVSGFEFYPDNKSKISLEGFYKWYRNYPFSVRDSINIASKGADYGIYGDEEVISKSKGRAYGLELLVQDKDFFGFNLILSYTLVRSEFTDKDERYVPSAWDNRHILNLTVLRSFKRNWDIGAKWRYVGGAPYTPADIALSSYRPAWDSRGREYPDYAFFNSFRLGSFHQLDIRIDKTYFFKKWSLNLYVDIQNIYNFQADNPPQYTNADKNGMINIYDVNGNWIGTKEQPPPGVPVDQQFYQLRTIPSESGTVLPAIGIIIEI